MRLGIPKIFKSLNELLDRFKFQLYVLCIWKNIQIYKRNKVGLCIEILWPLLFVGIVVLMRYNYGDRAYLRQDECHFYSKPLLSAGFFEFLHGYICHFNNTCHQEYVENDNFFANQTSQLSAAFLEINKFMEDDRNGKENILIQLLTQLGQYDSLKSDNKQTNKTYQRKELKNAKDKFSMGDFINLHQYFLKILRLPKVRRVLRHFQPLLNQFKDWISGSPTLYDDDIIAIIGGMKLVCGHKFYLDNEHLEKINVETFIKEILMKPFKTEYRDMKSKFCQNLDKKIKEIPMLNKIWITIKPLFIGKLLFTPRNAATWKIMQNVNSTFERFAFYHKFTKDFLNFLNVAFQKIKDIEGTEAFARQKIDILRFMRHLEIAYKISFKISEALDCLNVDRIEGFSTESELVDHARHHIDQNTFFAGIVFLDMEDNKKEGPTDNLTTIHNFVRYKIRMDSQKIDPTDSLFDDDEPYSPRRHPLTHLKYYYHGFVILQELLDTAITDVYSNNSILSESYVYKPRVILQQNPHPCYNRDQFLRSFYWILPFQICLSWTLTIAIIILSMVEESENQLQQYHRLLGMNDTILIFAQLATFLIPTFISSVLTALILFKGKILIYSDTLAIVSILFNYGMTTVCLGILLATLLRKYSVSPYIGILMYLMFTFLPYYLNKAQTSLLFGQRIILWLIPSVPFLESFFIIIDLEIAQVGLQWDNIVFSQKELSMSFIDNFMILIFDAILFIGTSIMIEKAKTTFYWETYLKIWQILKLRFLRSVKEPKMGKVKAVKEFIQNDLYMEKEHFNSKCSIEIKNLTKESENGRILDNVSVKFYENQLICLLTDNPTTGNALLSMIIKLQYEDIGSLHIYDNNNDQVKHVYRKIGYMPRYYIAIDQLTVEENLWFYTKLMDSEKNINLKDIEEIMKSAHLFDVRNLLANKLSTKLYRRLCVAIAFVGKGRIVLLQDPFCGLDSYSKHVLCDMLIKYKADRTIVVTTNNINDVGIISDKIAVFIDGRLLCYGSKTFLKTKYTNGFELRIELTNIEDIIGIGRQLRFVSLPEKFEYDIKNGFERDNHIINIFLQIMRHFNPDSSYISKLGQTFVFVLPYKMKDGIYDCIGNTLALKKLFCLLDRCRSQWETLKYEYSTLSTSEVYENIKLNNSNLYTNTFGQEETKLNITSSGTTAMAKDVDYLILSSDSLSEHFVSFKQFSSIQIARIRRNYRNIKYALKLLVAPFFILPFILIWIRFIPTSQIIYPVPLSNLLNPNAMEIFVGGLLVDSNSISANKRVGDIILKAFVESPTTFYIKRLGKKCVYLIPHNTTDFNRCKEDNITCHITAFNHSGSSYGLDNINIYKTILHICKKSMAGTIYKLSAHKAANRSSLYSQDKCFCDNMDGKANCPDIYYQPAIILSPILYIVRNIDNISLPAFLTLDVSNKYINGFETLIKNKSYYILREQKYDIRKSLKIRNITSLSTKLEFLYLNQIHHLRYLTHIPDDNIKIWFNNRLKIGMPSFLSTYDTAYFQRISYIKDIFNSLESNNKNNTKFHHYSPDFDNSTPSIRSNVIDEDYGFITINHPIHSSFKAYANINTIIYLYIIIFVQVCVTSLITTMILWDAFEDSHNYMHQFQLQKIYPLFQVFTNSIYNFGVYILATMTYLLIFKIKIGFLEHFNYFYSAILYILYGWTLIPFVQTVTYLKPTYSIIDINIINISIGMLCLLLEIAINIQNFTNETLMLLLTFFIPHYGFEKCLFILIGSTFKQYEIKYPTTHEINWEYSFNNTFILSGVIYYTIVCCYECRIFKKGKQILCKYLRNLLKFLKLKEKSLWGKKQQDEEYCLQVNSSESKFYENNIENKIIKSERKEVEMSDPSRYPILIKNATTNKLNKLCFKIENGSCLGLFGCDLCMMAISKLLIGQDIQFQGDIHVMGHNIKFSQVKVANFIGHVPNDSYLNTYLTPRESLEFYAHLKYKLSATCKKAVDFLINHFDIKENRWIKYCLESTKRKLVIAIALMLNPPILILNKPMKDLCVKDTLIVEKTLLDLIAMDKCILVLSNSVKDCKTVCSKLAIYDDKNIKCFGTLKDLKSRFVGAYIVSVEFNKSRQKKYSHNTRSLLAQRLIGTFPSSLILKQYMGYIEVCIFCPNLQISRIFITLEAVRNLYEIYDYSIYLASLEEIITAYSNSHDDYLSEDMASSKRLYDIPYASSL